MEPIKTRGLDELNALAKRVRRARALQRIAPDDFVYIDKRLREVEARIVAMTETDKNGEEVGRGW